MSLASPSRNTTCPGSSSRGTATWAIFSRSPSSSVENAGTRPSSSTTSAVPVAPIAHEYHTPAALVRRRRRRGPALPPTGGDPPPERPPRLRVALPAPGPAPRRYLGGRDRCTIRSQGARPVRRAEPPRGERRRLDTPEGRLRRSAQATARLEGTVGDDRHLQPHRSAEHGRHPRLDARRRPVSRPHVHELPPAVPGPDDQDLGRPGDGDPALLRARGQRQQLTPGRAQLPAGARGGRAGVHDAEASWTTSGAATAPSSRRSPERAPPGARASPARTRLGSAPPPA